MKPTFSIVIPALNEEKTLPHLLNDLAKQTFQNFEVIVVDGNSDDRTVAKVKQFQNKFQSLQVIISDKRNVSYQRNLGAKKSESDWIIFSDADNRIPDYFLQGIKYKIEMYKPDILSPWLIPDSNNRTDKTIALFLNILIDMQKSSQNPYVQESMMIVKKTIFNRLHGFNENLHWGEGNDFINRANRLKFKFRFIREPKYTFSFRRFRKLGTFKSISRSTQMDFARILHIKMAKDKASRIYPLEGGQYFEFDPKDKTTIEDLFLKLFQRENGSGKKKQNDFWHSLKEKFF